jgi:poly(3-hydroxyalkanoate) depolymerase
MSDRVEVVRLGRRKVRLRVRVQEGCGIPLVICNGIGSSLEVLDPLIEHLAPTRTVVRFDVPGAGESPLPPAPYTFPSLARALGRMLDQLGYDDVEVLGYSWGGALAQQFALQNPKRCRRLVLAATSTGVLMVPAKPHVLLKMLTPRRFNDPKYMASIAAKIYGGAADASSASVAALLDYHRSPATSRGYVYQLLAGSIWTSVFALGLIRQPTLIVAGTDDPLIPFANARIMHWLLPNAQMLRHAGGHVDLLTSAAWLGPKIEAFLQA